MLKVHVVTPANSKLYETELDEFYRLRHRSFALEKGWVPLDPNELERDAYDTEDATYFLGMEGDKLVVTSRLLPCSVPNMVTDVFPHLCERKGVPQHSNWADWTRLTVTEELRGGKHSGRSGAMITAIMEYCVDEGIEYVGGVQDMYFLPRWAELGWHVEIMGMPISVGHESFVVAYFRCDEDALTAARSKGDIDYPLLVRRGEQKPFVVPIQQENRI